MVSDRVPCFKVCWARLGPLYVSPPFFELETAGQLVSLTKPDKLKNLFVKKYHQWHCKIHILKQLFGYKGPERAFTDSKQTFKAAGLANISRVSVQVSRISFHGVTAPWRANMG